MQSIRAVIGYMVLAVSTYSLSAAPVGANFTYQGRLDQNGQPATGNYTMRFALYDTQAPGGILINGTNLLAVAVTNGLFTTDLDFGLNAFVGEECWLEIAVSTNNGVSFTTLLPRTRVAPTPNAIYASTAGTAATVASGAVVKSLNGLQDNISLIAGVNVTLTPSGNNLTINSSGNGAFSLNSTNAYYNAGNVGIGTSSPMGPLDVRSGTGSFLRMDSTYGDLHFNGGSDGTFGFINESGSTGSMVFYGNNNLLMSILHTGNVGIGTVSPATSLHISGPNSRLRLESSSSAQWTTTEYQTDARTWHTGVGGSAVQNGINSKYYIGDFTAGLVRMVVDTNGNVGIGTLSPQARLDVNGDISMSNGDLRLLSGDAGQGLGWYGSGKLFGGSDLNGPVLYGWGGGTLGSKEHGERRHLAWYSDGSAYLHMGGNGFWIDDGINGGNGYLQFNPAPADFIYASSGARLTRAGVWQNSSDRNRKTDFEAVDGPVLLARLSLLPLRSWRYTNEATTVRHIGPTAQDFKAAFGLGDSDVSIGTIDAEGVALLAIQALNQIVEEKDARISVLETDLAALKEQLEAQQGILTRWESRLAALEGLAAHGAGQHHVNQH